MYGLRWPTGVLNPVSNSEFLRHLIRCGKSDTKKWCRDASVGCWTLHFTDFALASIPNTFHMFLFQLAPSQVMNSTNSPLFSARIVASTTTFARMFPFILPVVPKHPIIWLHLPWKGTKRMTSPWSEGIPLCISAVRGPKSTKLIIPEFCTANCFDNFNSSMSRPPWHQQASMFPAFSFSRLKTSSFKPKVQ